MAYQVGYNGRYRSRNKRVRGHNITADIPWYIYLPDIFLGALKRRRWWWYDGRGNKTGERLKIADERMSRTYIYLLRNSFTYTYYGYTG